LCRATAAGHDLQVADPPEGQRILASAVEERFTHSADGELVPMTPGSTEAVAEVRRHAGIFTVKRYSFLL